MDDQPAGLGRGLEGAAREDHRAVGVTVDFSVRIPMRDQIKLSAAAYHPPAGTGPAPAIVALTPYVAQSLHEYSTYFATQGFVFIAVDTRGRGNSEGVFNPYVADPDDGHDIVEWAAAQPFCSGQVGMWGGSYSGCVQWQTASRAPRHLATIAPVASPVRGLDSPMFNNMFAPYRAQWLTLIAGRTSQDKVFADQAYWNRRFREWYESGTSFRSIDGFFGTPSPILQEWLRNPEQGPYWDAQNPTAEQYANLNLPILSITGVYDLDQPGAIAHYREHLRHNAEARRNHFLVIGPWDHAGTRAPVAEFGGLRFGPESLLDLKGLHRDWYRWTMQSGDKPEFLKANVACYVAGAEHWRHAAHLDDLTARHQALYLTSNGNPDRISTAGTLAATPQAEADPDRYIYDPADFAHVALEEEIGPDSLVDQSLLRARAGKHLIYDSAPFDEDVEICGFFKMNAWIAIDQPDTDFSVAVYEIGADENSVLLTRDTLRARYRQSPRNGEPVTIGEPLLYRFQTFMFTARLIRKKHRLRLVLGPVHSIFSQRNGNGGGVVADETLRDARPVEVTLFHDARHPSLLEIPIGAAA